MLPVTRRATIVQTDKYAVYALPYLFAVPPWNDGQVRSKEHCLQFGNIDRRLAFNATLRRSGRQSPLQQRLDAAYP